MPSGTNSSMQKQVVQVEVLDPTLRTVSVTASTVTLDKSTHDYKTVILDRAAGITVTMPAATGTGNRYRLVVNTALSGGSHVINRAGSDVFKGVACIAGGTSGTFSTATATAITLNATTKGGLGGDEIVLEDIASGVWAVQAILNGSGVAVTPFS